MPDLPDYAVTNRAHWTEANARYTDAKARERWASTSVTWGLCSPPQGQVQEQLQRPQRGLHRLEWEDEPGVEFHLGNGELFQLLRNCGFEVLDLIELFAAPGAVDHPYYSYVTAEWAKKWPAEEIWRARKL